MKKANANKPAKVKEEKKISKKDKKDKNSDLHQVPVNQLTDPAMIGENKIKIAEFKSQIKS